METSTLFNFIVASLESFFNDSLDWNLGSDKTKALAKNLEKTFPGRITIRENFEDDPKAFDIIIDNGNGYVITVFPLANTFYFEA